MSQWKVSTSEAVLRITVLLLFLEHPLGNASSTTEAYDKNGSKSRTTWCVETNACVGCRGINRTRCLKPFEDNLSDADLCGCCSSCISIRDLGESCGSQLSVSSKDSAITVLATTWCRKGLACVNFACHHMGGNIEPEISPRFESEKDFHTFADSLAQGAKTEPEVVDDSSTPKTVTQSSASSLTKSFASKKNTEPCHERSEEKTISHQSDDLLGRVEEIVVNDKRFQLVYSGDMLSELEILTSVVDRRYEDSLLKVEETDSLFDGFLNLLFLPGEEELLGDQRLTHVSGNQNSTFLEPCRDKRELVESEDPKNIEEILIRGASAHKEYFEEVKNQMADSIIVNKSFITVPVETQSQGDESTVRIHITTRPRRIQTLIDLEEDEEIGDEENRNKGRIKNVGRLSPLADEEVGASLGVRRPFGVSGTTKSTEIFKNTAKSENEDAHEFLNNTQLNETLKSLDDRLTHVEIKIDVVETVLEEIAKWCNLGVLSMTRDCVVPQNSDVHYVRWSPEMDERLALASGIDAIKFSENRRKQSSVVMPRRNLHHRHRHPEIPGAERRIDYRNRNYEALNKNFFRTTIDDGQIARRPIDGQSRTGNSKIKSPCRNSSRQDFTRDRSIPVSSGPLKVDRSKRMVETSPWDLMDIRNCNKTLDETQIPVPVTLQERVWKLESLKEIFPQRWVSAEKNNETGRKKRSVKNIAAVSHLSPHFEMLKKLRSGFPSATRQAGNLFQREAPTKNETLFDASGNTEHRDFLTFGYFPLIVAEESSELLTSSNDPEIANQRLFKNPQELSTSATATSTTPKKVRDKFLDPRVLLPYSITANRNSTIRIEEIGAIEYDDDILPETRISSGGEDDFDHIYEGVETEGDDAGDFEYDVPYDHVEYVDGSSVEIVTEIPDQVVFGEPETELSPRFDEHGKGIHDVLFRHGRNGRDLKTDNDECESSKQTKRDSGTVASPSKWIRNRRDRIQRSEGSQVLHEDATMNYKFSTMRPAVTIEFADVDDS